MQFMEFLREAPFLSLPTFRWKQKRRLNFEIKKLESELNKEITYTHVPREKNKDADRMVNLALDNRI